MPSLFSKIASGEIPSANVYEDADTLAFMDINPAARGHVLVICKGEYASLYDLPEAALLATARTTHRVARAMRAALNPDGLNIVQNNGAAAGQVVFHYHVHLIPRWDDDGVLQLWRPNASDADELHAVAAQIRQTINF